MLLTITGPGHIGQTGMTMSIKTLRPIEWPTVWLALGCYATWALAVFVLARLSLSLAILMTVLATSLHSSLTHEVIHGHPFRWKTLNAALAWPPLSIFIPFARFRDSHLAHHTDSRLTDPYDDPESNYLDAGDWEKQPALIHALRSFNNRLAGRLLIGPLLGQVCWMRADWQAIRRGDSAVLMGWVWHIPAVAAVLAVVWLSAMPVWIYLICAYCALSILKIRTFLEHQAHERVRCRTVIIEDRGVLAFLFLNNNFHAVHHMHPRVAWFLLPKLYFAQPEKFLGRNGGYRFASYAEVFRRYFFSPKDPIAHPLWRR